MATLIRGSQIQSGTITNLEIAASAAIATTKLADGASFFKRDGSVVATAAFNLGGFKISSLGDPTLTADAVNKGYVDALVGNGLAVKTACAFTTTGNVTLSGLGTQAGGDWASPLTASDRVLVKNNTTASENGIYVVSAGAWTRASDFDTSINIVTNAFFFVGRGTTLADSGWVMTTDGAIVVGTTGLVFQQFSSTGTILPGIGLSKTGNTLDVNIGDGLENASNFVAVKLDGSTLARSAAGIKLANIASANFLVGNGSSIPTAVAMSGDATMANTGAVTVAATIAKYANFIFGEVPSGSVNGVNQAFTLANTPQAGTACVYINGIRMFVGAGNDFTISGGTITFTASQIPQTGDTVLVDYVR